MFLLPGCAMSDETTAKWFADPGKFEFHSCEQLAVAFEKTTEQRDKLDLAIARAERDRSGKLVSTLVYKSDYLVERI